MSEVNLKSEQLSAVVATVSKEVGSLATDKKNTDKNYFYISSDKILEKAGEAMANNGLVVIPSITECRVEHFIPEKGSPHYDAYLSMIMKICVGEQSETVMWYGVGVDYSSPDKAFYKAITSGHKYFLMKLFNIGVGNEDGEHENGTDANSKQASVQSTQKQVVTKQLTPTQKAVDDLTKLVKGNANKSPSTPEQQETLKAVLLASFGETGKNKIGVFNKAVTGKQLVSDFTAGEIITLLQWLGANESNGYTPNEEKAKLAKAIAG